MAIVDKHGTELHPEQLSTVELFYFFGRFPVVFSVRVERESEPAWSRHFTVESLQRAGQSY